MYRIRHFMKTRKKIIHRAFLMVAYFFIFIALLSTAFRALTPMAKQYKPRVEEILSQALGYPVHIQALAMDWYWFEPVLKVEHVGVEGKEKPVIEVQQVEVGMSIWKSLWYWRFQPGLVWIEGADITVKETPDAWMVNGLRFDKTASPTQDLALFSVILEQKKCHLKNINLSLSLATQGFELKNIDATLLNRLGEHRLRGQVYLVGKRTSLIDFGAEIVLSPQVSGHVYVGVDQFNFQPWMHRLPLPKTRFQSIHGRVQLWGEIFNDKLSAIEARFDLKDVRWLNTALNKSASFPRVEGKARFEYLSQGFKLIVQELQLTDKKGQWPLNEIVLKANPEKQDYVLSVQSLPIERVLKLPIEASLDFLPPHLTGTLKSFLIEQHQGELSLLTGFENVGFQPKDNLPGVEHLSGALVFEKQRGRLAINSKNLVLQFKKYPALDLPALELEFKWEKQANQPSPEFELASLSLTHPYLKLHAVGAISAERFINAKAQFEAQDATYWLTYLPKAYLKPKLYRWLREDIRQIGGWNGEIKVKGPLQDFPFDKGNGVFRINTTLSQAQLIFAPGWPMAKDIEGGLFVNGRLLTAVIHHAFIKDAPIASVKLAVNDLGLDKEHLRLQGKVQSSTPLGWPVLLDSPIGKGQDFLKALHWQGPMDLDLNIDASLYPGNDSILVLGDVDLKKDNLLIDGPVFQLNLEDLSGHLRFDEHGFLNSQLVGTVWGQTLPLNWKASETLPRTASLKMKVQATPALVFETLKLAPIAGVKGKTTLKVEYTLPFDRTLPQVLHFQSRLKGVGVDIPHVFTKSTTDTVPLESTVQVYTAEPVELSLHYGDLATVALNKSVWDIQTHFPDFASHVNYTEGLLSGKIEKVTFKKESLNTTELIHPAALPKLSLTIQNLTYGTLDFGTLTFKTKKIKEGLEINSWTLDTPAYAITGSGLWTETKKGQQSQVKLNLKTPNVRNLLEHFQFSPFLEVGKAEVVADLYWSAGLNQFSLEKTEGDINLHIKEGRTTNFSPETESKLGLARLLSVLSLRTIPRRLKLDFSDLAHEGYSFDDVEGQFELDKGILGIETLFMDGPAAAATISGEANVIKQTLNLTIQVIPHVTASLPVVAATIVGGPIAGPVAGVATWAASRLINRGVQKITTYNYRMTGPFADPKMEPVKLR